MNTKQILATIFISSQITLAQAAIITFDGGLIDGSTQVSPATNYPVNDNSTYTENGLVMTVSGSSSSVGNYYGGNNNVVHFHFAGSSMTFSMQDGSLFDLNSFDLTSNTETGGGTATGNEFSTVTASNAATFTLPSNDWGGTFSTLSFGGLFTNISSFSVNNISGVFCLGLDNINISAAVSNVSEPTDIALLLSGFLAFNTLRKKKLLNAMSM